MGKVTKVFFQFRSYNKSKTDLSILLIVLETLLIVGAVVTAVAPAIKHLLLWPWFVGASIITIIIHVKYGKKNVHTISLLQDDANQKFIMVQEPISDPIWFYAPFKCRFYYNDNQLIQALITDSNGKEMVVTNAYANMELEIPKSPLWEKKNRLLKSERIYVAADLFKDFYNALQFLN